VNACFFVQLRLKLTGEWFGLRKNSTEGLRDFDRLLGPKCDQSHEEKEKTCRNHEALFSASSLLLSVGFSSPLMAALNPRIASPSPFPSSGSFLGPKMRSAIPAITSRCMGSWSCLRSEHQQLWIASQHLAG
jgi:hypothetical protein